MKISEKLLKINQIGHYADRLLSQLLQDFLSTLYVKSSGGINDSLEKGIAALKNHKDETEKIYEMIVNSLMKKKAEILTNLDAIIAERSIELDQIKGGRIVQGEFNEIFCKEANSKNFDLVNAKTNEMLKVMEQIEKYYAEGKVRIKYPIFDYQRIVDSINQQKNNSDEYMLNSLKLTNVGETKGNDLLTSKIIKKTEEANLLIKWINEAKKDKRVKVIKRIFCGNVHGFGKNAFEKLCYEQPPSQNSFFC